MTPLQKIGMIEDNVLYMKREDLLPFSFGGNKARKAELFFREIDAGPYDSVVTYGSGSSNHCRVVANMCIQRNMPCYIISPVETSAESFNQKMMRLFGAEIISVHVSEVKNRIDSILSELRNQGRTPFFIPGGGHGKTGTQAYVNCYQEIKEYEENNGIVFDQIYLASGTGTTQAGLICGKMIHHDPCEIIGISIARKNPYGRNVIMDSVKEYFDDRIEWSAVQSNTVFLDDYISNGYGQSDLLIRETVFNVLEQYGIPLDETYTGKAFSGMIQQINSNKIQGKNILFIHTGGTPLFFDTLREWNEST